MQEGLETGGGLPGAACQLLATPGLISYVPATRPGPWNVKQKQLFANGFVDN